jgi:hypothetical protein
MKKNDDSRLSTFSAQLGSLRPNSVQLCTAKIRAGHESATLIGRNCEREGEEQAEQILAEFVEIVENRRDPSRIRRTQKCWTLRGASDSSELVLDAGDGGGADGGRERD